MKQLLFLFALTIALPATGQPLTYKGEFVDTIQIMSNSSHYHFDDHGTTTGIYDEYIIVFDKLNNNYIVNPYRRTRYTYTIEPDTAFFKEKVLKKGQVVERSLVSNLLNQFEVSYSRPTFENIGISREQFLKLTDEKHIIQVAKWHRADWQFKKKYSYKEDNEAIFKGCQNIDSLNLYLSTAFDTSGYTIISDVDQSFDVIISAEKSRYRFEGKYPNPFKQPWYNHSTNDVPKTKPVLNLSINRALVAILPDQFCKLETLKFEALTNDYIKWYLRRCGVIF